MDLIMLQLYGPMFFPAMVNWTFMLQLVYLFDINGFVENEMSED